MKAKKSKAVLLLGSNSGDRVDYINKAMSFIQKLAGKITLESAFYQTSPWGFTDQPDFLNKVVVVETYSEPLKLLQTFKSIEKELGRINNEKWKQRCIDIDILFYDELIFNSDELIIPHPLLHKRRFTLVPLNEIMPGFTHPLLKKKTNELLNDCEDAGEVKRWNTDFSKI